MQTEFTMFAEEVQQMNCFPKMGMSSDTNLKIPTNEENENLALGYLAKGNERYENEVMGNNKITRTSLPG